MRLFKQLVFATALTLGVFYGMALGHSHEFKLGDLVIGHPWSRQSPKAATEAAGFMTITNGGAEADRLIKATADIAPTVQLHDMKMEGDVMKMFELVEGIPIPAGATVELKPKSLHVMFLGLKSPPKEGDTFKATLTFKRAGTIDVEFTVEGPTEGM
jgi:hypothetical protein